MPLSLLIAIDWKLFIPMNSDNKTYDLCVLGYVFFEMFLPKGDIKPNPGEEIYSDDIHVGLGGALNTTSVAKALGLDVVLLYPHGKGFTDFAISAFLESRGIASKAWKAKNNPGITMVFPYDNDRAFLSREDKDALNACPDFPKAKWIHLAGLNEANVLEKQIEKARADGSNICVSGCWRPEEFERVQKLENCPWDLLILNDKEAEAISGGIPQAFDTLPGRAAKDLVVTKGKDGAEAFIGGKHVSVKTETVEALDFTGAGDAFCGGLLSALIKGKKAEEALRIANKTAARILRLRGGVVEDFDILSDLEELL